MGRALSRRAGARPGPPSPAQVSCRLRRNDGGHLPDERGQEGRGGGRGSPLPVSTYILPGGPTFQKQRLGEISKVTQLPVIHTGLRGVSRRLTSCHQPRPLPSTPMTVTLAPDITSHSAGDSVQHVQRGYFPLWDVSVQGGRTSRGAWRSGAWAGGRAVWRVATLSASSGAGRAGCLPLTYSGCRGASQCLFVPQFPHL